MEIVHLILGKANPERMNGVNKVVYNIAYNQKLEGRNVSIWGITKEKIINFPDRIFNTHLFQAYINPFKMDDDLKKALLAKKDDIIVHLHGGWIPIYYTISKFLNQNNIPYVITAHGAYNTIAMDKSKLTKMVYFSLFEKYVLKYAHKIHVLGKSEMKGIELIYPNNKTELLSYGFEYNETNYKVLKSKKFIIGFLGRIDIYTKGLDIIINSMSEILKKHSNIELWIIGDGEEKTDLKRMIEAKNIQNKVKLLGSKFGEEKNNILANLSILIQTSRNEGLPVSILEASSFGIPSIVSRATNIGEVIQKYNAGIEVENDNITDTCFAIDYMYMKWKNNLLGEFKENCVQMVKNEFNWSKTVLKLDDLYQK